MTEPLHDSDSERALIGCILLDADAYHEVNWLTPGDFAVEHHAEIWRSLCRIISAGQTPDMVTIHADLVATRVDPGRVGGIDYVAECTLRVPSTAAVVHYAGIVRGLSLRRQIQRGAVALAQHALEPDATAQSCTEMAERLALSVTPDSRAGKTAHISEAARRTWQNLERLQANRDAISGVPYGFPKLDRATHGLQPGELTLLGARPSVGKTALGLNVAAHAAKAGRRVLFVSVEMTEQGLMERLLSIESATDAQVFRSGRANAAAWGSIAQAIDIVTALPLWIHDAPGISLTALRSTARRHQARDGLDLVVVDYLQLIQASGRDARERVTEVSAGLKQMARELAVPVLALCQLSRESERRPDGEPMLSDLRESGTLEQDADVVLLLWRPEMFKDGGDPGKTKLKIAKNRNGPTFDVPLHFTSTRTQFREVSAPEYGGGF